MIKINKTHAYKVLVVPAHKMTIYSLSSMTVKYGVITNGLPYNEIKAEVDRFIKLAKSCPLNSYYITGFENATDIAPMFALAPLNCVFPLKWEDILGTEEARKYWNG